MQVEGIPAPTLCTGTQKLIQEIHETSIAFMFAKFFSSMEIMVVPGVVIPGIQQRTKWFSYGI